MIDCVIIGNGPAGISSAIYIKRAGKNPIIIGKNGGELEKAKKIENYYGFINPISGRELIENGINQARRLGIDVLEEEVINIEKEDSFVVRTNKNIYNTKSVILATGASRETPSIKGIKEFEGRGVSYCATCDAFFYRGKNVAVLGNGEYALSEAQELLPIVNSVTILTNGKLGVENRSSDIDVQEKEIKEFSGKEIIEEVKFEDNSKIGISGVFVAEGVASSSDFARKIGAVIDNNYIVVDNDMQTNVKGLFAAGDCIGGLLQISKAVGDGAKAGLSVVKYIKEEEK